MRRRTTVAMTVDLRGAALEEARASVGFRRARTADLLVRARAFEAWLKPAVVANDYAGWLLRRRALQLYQLAHDLVLT